MALPESGGTAAPRLVRLSPQLKKTPEVALCHVELSNVALRMALRMPQSKVSNYRTKNFKKIWGGAVPRPLPQSRRGLPTPIVSALNLPPPNPNPGSAPELRPGCSPAYVIFCGGRWVLATRGLSLLIGL